MLPSDPKPTDAVENETIDFGAEADPTEQDSRKRPAPPDEQDDANSHETLDSIDPEVDESASGETLDSVPSSETVADLSGRTLRNYAILGELGRGGMGVVYQARQKGLDRVVALKMLSKANTASKVDRDRFRTEGEAVAKLRHPNIVQIFEVGEEDGNPFFSLEFVEGGSLDVELAGEPRPAREAAGLVRSLAEAMQAAHEAGVVHRDLKPANVLLTQDGQPKITDFGLAKKLDRGDGPTQSGSILGTPSYMAPEQAFGDLEAIGPSVDIYALGSILYECLTGRPPFKGATLWDTLDQVKTQDPVAPSRLTAGIPLDLETICLKCLHKEPQRRYSSAAELAEDLGRFLDDQPIEARPTSRAERAWKWAKRRPAVAGLLAALTVAILGGLTATTLLYLRAEGRRKEAVAARKDTEKARAEAVGQRDRANEETERANGEAKKALDAQKRAEDATRDTERVLTRQYVAEGERLVAKKDYLAAVLPWTRALTLAKDDSTKRVMRQRLGALNARCPELLDLRVSGGGVNHLALDAERKRAVVSYGNGEVRVWTFPGGEPISPVLRHPSSVEHSVFSPDGSKVATACRDSRVRIWEVVSGRLVVEPMKHEHPVFYVSWSQDGATLVTAADNNLSGAIRVWDAKTGKQMGPRLIHKEEKLEDPAPLEAVDVHPGGKVIAVRWGFLTERVSVWRLGGEKPESVTLAARDVKTMKLDPSGEHLVLGTRSATWYSTKSGVTTGRTIPHDSSITSLSFSPDGTRLLTTTSGGIARVWNVKTGKPASDEAVHPTTVLGGAFSGDGKRFVTTSLDLAARVWDAKTANAVSPPLHQHRSIRAFALDTTGKHLLAGSGDGVMRTWGLTQSLPVSTFGSINGPFSRHCLTPKLTYAVAPMLSGFSGSRLTGYDLVKGRRLGRAGPPPRPGGFGRPPGRSSGPTVPSLKCAAIHPGGSVVVGGSFRREAVIFDLRFGRSMGSVRTGAPVNVVAFSPDGLLAYLAGSETRLYHPFARRAVGKVMINGPMTNAIEFSPDGKYLATIGYHGDLHLYEVDRRSYPPGQVDTAEPKAKFPSIRVRSVRFRPDSKRLAVACRDGSARIIDVETGKVLPSVFAHNGTLRHAEFSPDGKLLGTASNDFTARVWDADSGEPITPPMRHPREVRSISFDPKGERVATTCADGSARVWEVATGQVLGPALPCDSRLSLALFSPEGDRVLTASSRLQWWRVLSSDKPVEELTLRAEVLSGGRFDPKTGLLSSTPAELAESWERLNRARSEKE